MPTRQIKKTTKSVIEADANIENDVVKEKIARTEKKKFKDTDVIPCKSITSGELGMIGVKTNINYTWFGRNDIVDVEYQDLTAAIRSGKKQVLSPAFVIQDDDFIAEFPQIAKIYDSMFSTDDLKDIFDLSPNQMKSVILQLPTGAKESIKHIAATEISSGRLDSVQKIKALDDIFDTKFMVMTELVN